MTIRAVRVEARVLATLQAFAKPGGQIFLFRGSGHSDPSESVTPPLAWKATYPLIESLRSRLVVLEKRASRRRAFHVEHHGSSLPRPHPYAVCSPCST